MRERSIYVPMRASARPHGPHYTLKVNSFDLNPIQLWDSGFEADSAHGQKIKDFR